MSERPYGPNTAMIRRFLVRLAGLGTADRVAVVERYQTRSASVEWHTAEALLATTIERSGRDAARDALSGPLLQLVRPAHAQAAANEDDWLSALDPIAEPALAALLGLLVSDLLSAPALHTLLSPFEGAVSMADINGVDAPAPSTGH
ncbi:hypothetical protein [Gemmatimonas sp.]